MGVRFAARQWPQLSPAASRSNGKRLGTQRRRVLRAVEKDIHSSFELAAREDHGARAQLDQLARSRFHRRDVLDFHSGEQLGLGNVWRDYLGAFHQLRTQVLDPRSIQQLRPTGRFQGSVENHMRKLMLVEEFGNYGGISSASR